MSRHTLPKSIIHSFNSTYYWYCASSRPICYALLVFMQITRDLFAMAKLCCRQTDKQTHSLKDTHTDAAKRFTSATIDGVSNKVM